MTTNTFARRMDKLPPLPPLSALPTPTAEYYVDVNKLSIGKGTQADPWNVIPGETSTPAYISNAVAAGSRIYLRGTWRGFPTVGANLGSLGTFSKAGADGAPIQYVAASEWGRFRIDPTTIISTRPCINQADAFGNPNWANLRRGVLPANTGNDWLHVIYRDRERFYISQCPPIPDMPGDNGDPIKKLQRAEMVSAAMGVPAFWVTHSSTESLANNSNGLFPIERLRAFLTPDKQALLDAALSDPNQKLLLTVRQGANQIFLNTSKRVDSLGADAPTTGAFITGVDRQFNKSGSGPYSGSYDHENKYSFFNLPAFIDTPGQGAYNNDAGQKWVIYWPMRTGEVLTQSDGRAGFKVTADYLIFFGFTATGLATSSFDAGVGRNMFEFTGTRTKVDFLYCRFLGDNSLRNRGGAFLSMGDNKDCRVINNTFTNTFLLRSILLADNLRLKIENNHFKNVNGTNVGALGDSQSAAGLIKNNLFEDCNGVHSQPISLYTHLYNNFTVEGNIIKNSARPLTASSATTWVTTLFGEAVTKGSTFKDNVFQVSGVDEQATGFMWNGSGSEGQANIVFTGNLIDAAATPVTKNAFSAPYTVTFSNNRAIGGVAGGPDGDRGMNLREWNAGANNVSIPKNTTDTAQLATIAAWKAEIASKVPVGAYGAG